MDDKNYKEQFLSIYDRYGNREEKIIAEAKEKGIPITQSLFTESIKIRDEEIKELYEKMRAENGS